MRAGPRIRLITSAAAVAVGLAATTDVVSAQGLLPTGGPLSGGGLLTPGSLFPSSLFPQSSLFPSSLLPTSGLYPSSLLPQSGLFSNSLFPQSSLFPSSLLPTSGLFPNTLLPQSGLFSNSLLPQSGLFPTSAQGGSSMFSTSTLFPQNSLFPTLFQSNVFSTTLPSGQESFGGPQSFGGFMPPLRVISLGGAPSSQTMPPLGGQVVNLGGQFSGTAKLPLAGSAGGGTTSVPVQGVFSAQGTLPPGTVLGSPQGATISPANGVLTVAPPIVQNTILPVVGLAPSMGFAPPQTLLDQDTILAGLLLDEDVFSLRHLLGGVGDLGFGLGDLGFSDGLRPFHFHSGHHGHHG